MGLLDADIYGPNVPLMLGAPGQPGIAEGKILPLRRYGFQVMSVGYLLGEHSQVIWRRPLVAQAMRQLLTEVRRKIYPVRLRSWDGRPGGSLPDPGPHTGSLRP
jgi:Mrp family chromosome partitioning ATPase